MNLVEVISFTTDLVGLLSDLKDFLPSDSNANANPGDIVLVVGYLRSKREKP
ncbi:hypothetical protein [Peribacillus sp. FSL R5-0717]|uniref:hypothetical protein n=1 Tax=Peribacillus sp. FSL R5-0717 TaxID=2975308 RepID=UPI0030FB4D03